MSDLAVISLELEIPTTGSAHLLGGQTAHMESSIQDTCMGWSTAFHTLKTTDTEFVDKLVNACMISASPVVHLRIGLGSGSNCAWTPRQSNHVLNHRSVLQGLSGQASYTIRLNTADPLWLMSKVTKVTARKGKISQIVASIAKENRIENTVIEETEGDGLYIQNYCSDTTFILERLRPRAVNSQGRGNYQLFFKHNVLHFHTPDYQARVLEVHYFSGGNEDLVQADHSTEARAAGSDNLRIVAYDPYEGQTKEVISVAEKVLKLADSQPSPIPGLDAVMPYHLSGNRPQEAGQMACVLRETARMDAYQLEMQQTASLQVEKGDFINLVVLSGVATTSPWSGLYYVHQVNRGILDGALASKLFLTRSEINLPTQGIPAVGQALNIRAVQSSKLTKGGGDGEPTVTREIQQA